MNPEQLFGKDYDRFQEIDPFNKCNKVGGFISKKSNEYYGALLITDINDEPVTPQLVMGTPKMNYPFITLGDGTRRYTFPSTRDIEVYEKLDGTNVLAYSYSDGLNLFYSFKTRLRPFISSGRFGDFIGMWQDVGMPHFNEIKTIILNKRVNLSFEMYGYKNPILILYSNALDIALLFGVTSAGNILSPEDLGLIDIDNNVLTSIPIVGRLNSVRANYVYNYEFIQDSLNKKLVKQEDKFIGTEGTVWYLHLHDGRCKQIKCKPEIIESIHFSAGSNGINRNSIITTCYNAMENVDVLTLDFVKQLLLEEFPAHIVDLNITLIESCITFVTDELSFRQEVLTAYRNTGKNLLLEKNEVMRELSSWFPKNKMKKVYSIIRDWG